MSDKKSQLLVGITRHCVQLLRNDGQSIFHDAIIHKESLNQAISPTVPSLFLSALDLLLKEIGNELLPAKVEAFYRTKQPENWYTFPAVFGGPIDRGYYEAPRSIDHQTVRFQKNEIGPNFSFADIPLVKVLIECELAGRILIKDGVPATPNADQLLSDVVVCLNEAFADDYNAAMEAKEKTTSLHLKKELDLSQLATLDIDGALSRVEEKRSGGGEVVDPSDDCESGACKI